MRRAAPSLPAAPAGGQLDARALVYVSIAVLTWSSAYASIAYALAAFTPGQLAFARLLLAAGLFQGYLRLRGIALPPVAAWPPMLALGVVGLAAYHLALNVAEMRVASGTAAILIALIPGATAVVSALWLRERLAARTVLGLAIALGGVGLVVISSGHRLHFQPRALLVLVSVLAAALYFTGQKPWTQRYGAEALTAVTLIGGALGAAPFGLGIVHALRAAPALRLTALLWLALGPTFLGYLTWNLAIHRASATQVSSFIYCSSPLAVLIGWLWLGERPGALTLAGGALVIGGVILANLRRGSAPAALES
ncbi:MAG: DMT family transporter [Steroidobacteraceae bacterium]